MHNISKRQASSFLLKLLILAPEAATIQVCPVILSLTRYFGLGWVAVVVVGVGVGVGVNLLYYAIYRIFLWGPSGIQFCTCIPQLRGQGSLCDLPIGCILLTLFFCLQIYLPVHKGKSDFCLNIWNYNSTLKKKKQKTRCVPCITKHLLLPA